MHLHRLLPFVMAADTVGNIRAHHLRKGMLPHNIIRVVAVIAGIYLVVAGLRMAGGAGDGTHPAVIQGEGVLKEHLAPALWRVAKRAVVAKLTQMHVILGVTGDALGWRAAVNIIHVALRAFHLLVLAYQLEGGEIVVENLSVPALTVMAAGTIRSKVGRVWILRFMAAHTIRWGILKRNQTGNTRMAVHTFNIGMSTKERKCQQVMVKLSLRKIVNPIMAGPAVIAVIANMGFDKAHILIPVAAFAHRWFKTRQTLRVAVLAVKWGSISDRLVCCQAKAKPLMIDL